MSIRESKSRGISRRRGLVKYENILTKLRLAYPIDRFIKLTALQQKTLLTKLRNSKKKNKIKKKIKYLMNSNNLQNRNVKLLII